MANNYQNTRIPSRANDGTPTTYFIVDNDGSHRTVTRSECLAHDEQGAPPLLVDPDGATVTRLPRTPASEQLARENMQSIWAEEKRAERWQHRQISMDTAALGESFSIDKLLLADAMDVASIVEDLALYDVLHAAVAQLSQADQHLIHELIWNGKTERELAVELGLKERKSVNKRKNRILEILRNHPALKSFMQEIS